MRKKGFIINVFIMTGSMLIIRLAGMVSNIYISAKAGAEAMGLYHVIFAVYSFAITVSVSGTGLAATRLISERLGRGSSGNAGGVIKKCLAIALSASFFAAFCLFFGADFISTKLVSEQRCTPAFKILALSLPAIGASAVMRGYFIAERRAGVLTASQIIEEFSSIFVTVLILKSYSGTPYAYMCMVVGGTVSELFALVFDLAAYKFCTKTRAVSRDSVRIREILSICVPVALGSYLRAGLVALENVMIPGKLAKFGVADPLSEYGLIRAMAMQILLFPTVFIQSFASMLVPEMSEMNAAKRINGIKHVATLAIKSTLLFAFASAAVFFKFHDELAVAMYKNKSVGVYLGMLSLLAVPMYLDTVVDSMLKGLNQQVSSLKYNIADSVLRVAAIWLFLPRFGVMAYIILLYASEVFNLTLSLGKLIAVSGVHVSIRDCVVLPAVCTGVSFFVINMLKFSSFVPEMIFFTAIYMTAAYGMDKITFRRSREPS